jgi:hypothetical protein
MRMTVLVHTLPFLLRPSQALLNLSTRRATVFFLSFFVLSFLNLLAAPSGSPIRKQEVQQAAARRVLSVIFQEQSSGIKVGCPCGSVSGAAAGVMNTASAAVDSHAAKEQSAFGVVTDDVVLVCQGVLGTGSYKTVHAVSSPCGGQAAGIGGRARLRARLPDKKTALEEIHIDCTATRKHCATTTNSLRAHRGMVATVCGS